jgi:hypothetical protein
VTNWIQGVFIYIEKLWQWFYCFWDQFTARALDFFLGVYKQLITMIASVLSAIPIPDTLINFQWPVLPQAASWAIYDLQLPTCLALLVGGATVRVTRDFLRMIK